MDRDQIRKIIKTRFSRDGEELVYCVHCLNPFLGAPTLENEHLSDTGFMGAFSADYRIRELLYLALTGLFGDSEAVSRRPHQCGQCIKWENRDKDHPGTTDIVFDDQTSVICCPHCLTPIHLGQGPYTPEGYRAELLRRATGGSFSIEQDLFEGEPLEPEVDRELHIEPPMMAGNK